MEFVHAILPENIPTGWADAFPEGRALWLSAIPDDLTEATRVGCEQANQWVERFCSIPRKRKNVAMPLDGTSPVSFLDRV